MKDFYNPTASSTYFREGKKLSAQNRKGDYIVENEKAIGLFLSLIVAAAILVVALILFGIIREKLGD